MSTSRFSNQLCFVHSDGRKLFPFKVKDLDTGRMSYRLTPSGGGNTKDACFMTEDELEMKKYVLVKGWGVRAREKRPGSIPSIYFKHGRSIKHVVEP